jgi:hypothetical protein
LPRTLSIQEAQAIAEAICREFGVSAVPPIYVTPNLPRQFAGAFYHDGRMEIRIRPEYLTERTVAHEVGHYLFLVYRPQDAWGGNPESEEVAQMVEKWWVARRSAEAKSLTAEQAVAAILAVGGILALGAAFTRKTFK